MAVQPASNTPPASSTAASPTVSRTACGHRKTGAITRWHFRMDPFGGPSKLASGCINTLAMEASPGSARRARWGFIQRCNLVISPQSQGLPARRNQAELLVHPPGSVRVELHSHARVPRPERNIKGKAALSNDEDAAAGRLFEPEGRSFSSHKFNAGPLRAECGQAKLSIVHPQRTDFPSRVRFNRANKELGCVIFRSLH